MGIGQYLFFDPHKKITLVPDGTAAYTAPMTCPILTTSRPRFWIYLIGPYLLGVTGGLHAWTMTPQSLTFACLWLLWLTFPANIIIYGINDLYDEETDALNTKKNGYEIRVTTKTRACLRKSIWLSIGLGAILWMLHLLALPSQGFWLSVGFWGFLFFGSQYSAPPIRAKTKPFVDSFFNILYLFPAFIGWSLSGSSTPFIWPLFVAGSLWCIAMHAFSAIPDIEADSRAGLRTIATVLGDKKTILLCGILYAGAGVIAFPWIRWLSFVGIALYALLMSVAWQARHSPTRLFSLYTLFPYVNSALGMCLWLMSAARILR